MNLPQSLVQRCSQASLHTGSYSAAASVCGHAALAVTAKKRRAQKRGDLEEKWREKHDEAFGALTEHREFPTDLFPVLLEASPRERDLILRHGFNFPDGQGEVLTRRSRVGLPR